jgi:hypothetical protein
LNVTLGTLICGSFTQPHIAQCINTQTAKINFPRILDVKAFGASIRLQNNKKKLSTKESEKKNLNLRIY